MEGGFHVYTEPSIQYSPLEPFHILLHYSNVFKIIYK